MEKKSTVVKSKSSNSAIITKIDKNKKCSSNYDIITNLKKKRGVYVEKSPNREEVLKPPKRPRPGKKKFLASVLTILSKSTAATQYPEKDNSDRKDRIKPRSTQKSDKPKKNKYKSRVLNDYMDDSVIVLKSKKELQQTPSTSSRNDNYKWSYNLQSKKPSQKSIKYILDNNIYSGVAEGPAKDVLKLGSNKKQLTVCEPAETDLEKPVDKKIYNFFVELLETTFDMYNEKELNCDMDNLKSGLELKESVLQKLIINGKSQVDDQKSYSKDIDSEKCKFLHSFYERSVDINATEPPKAKQKNKFLVNPKKDKPEKLNSFYVPKKGRKSRKALLDILKEELTKDVTRTTYEEPGNLYQALKVMAKNKKKSENSTRFSEKYLFERFSNKDCMLRRKVLFKSKKRNRKSDQKPKYGSRSFETGNNRFPSRHSLVVYGYDYEKPVKVEKPIETRQKGVPLHSSTSNEDSDAYCSSFDFPVAPTTHYSTYNDNA